MEKYFVGSFSEDIPKYIQIARHIKRLIEMDIIEDGEKLPSIRSLAKYLLVNNDTIINVYNRLQMEGYASQKIGSGTYAKKKELVRSYKKDYSDIFKKLTLEELRTYIDFTGENPCSDFFNVEGFKAVLNEVLDRDGAEALVNQEALGYYGLRSSINRYFWENRVDIENILIVSGAQQGIDIVSKAMINVNDNIIVEKPTYSGALSVFKGRRANIFEVPMEEDGSEIGFLREILKKNRIKIFYLMSYFQNPTGASYSLEKKLEILKLAEEYDFYIVEDDYLSELIYDEKVEYKSFKALDKNDRVIYIKSFSKIFLPGIRIGYLISPEKFKDQIQNSKIDTDISTSSLMQRALHLYIEKGFWKEHINNINGIYKERYYYVKEELEKVLVGKAHFNPPGGGLNFYIKIAEDFKIDCMTLFYKCKEKQVLLTPGVIFYKQLREGQKYFRLGFSKVDKGDIVEGLRVISEIIKSE